MSASWFDRLFPDRPPPTAGDFSTSRRLIPITFVAIGIGVASGFVALVLLRLIALCTNLFFFQRLSLAITSPRAHALGAWVVVVPILGGLVIGLMARFGSERIRGHGIPEALEAILIRGSRIQARLALLKPISSAVSIGSGGPFGAEGPIIMTGGAFGSLIAQGFHLTNAERKTLLVAGAAGGMTAVFGSPLAAMLLAVELLLFEWKPRSFVPVALACAAAMIVRQAYLEPGPLFHVPPHAPVLAAATLLGCLAAGLGAGALASLMTASVYLVEDLFQHRLRRLHWMWWPALAGAVVGVGGLVCPRALGIGFDSIADLLAGRMVIGTVLLLLAVKWTIWAVALGSGTSGGVVAPLLMLGALLGTVEGLALPSVGPGFWPLVSMAAVLGGTMRAPFTAILFAVEVTHDWDAILPIAIAVAVAHAFTVLVMRRSILTEKVARNGFHVTREYAIDPLEVLFVREVMRPASPSTPTDHALVAYGDETLRVIAYRMASADVTHLRVIDRSDATTGLGEISLQDLLAARRRHLEEETRRERIIPLPGLPLAELD